MIVMYANKNRLSVRARESVTSGSVNACEVRFEFSQDWEGLERAAVFRAGGESRSVLLDGSNTCSIPWEVLKTPNVQLLAGVCGTWGGELVLPTVWASLGVVLEGAALSEDAHPPTPDLWEQELAGKGDALEYDGQTLSLLSAGRPVSAVPIPSGVYQFGHGLKQEGLRVSIDAVDGFTGDNTLPMTAAGVQAAVGNIEALLGTI